MARKSKVVGTLPISFHNLGSAQAQSLDLRREALYTRMHDRLAELAVRIPVLLVNEAQMDSITPFHLTRGLNKHAVENLLREAVQQEREWRERTEGVPLTLEEPSPLQRAWDAIQGQIESLPPEGEPNYRAYWRRFIPVGLYFGRYSRMPNLSQLAQAAQAAVSPATSTGVPQITTPAIFICPERVLNWAFQLGIDPNLVFDKVLYHELGHAYMDTTYYPSGSVYDTPWGRVIEESLANCIAFSQFNKMEARYVQRLISTQPAEYQGYLTILRVCRFPSVATEWEYYLERLENWIMEIDRWWYSRLYRAHPLRGAWIETFSDSGTRRLSHWRRFKHEWKPSGNAAAIEEERFWQGLAAQVLLEV